MICLKTINRPLLLVISVLLLQNCANFNHAPEVGPGEWSFTGRMAIQADDEATSFNVDWLQQQGRYEIELSGPLGQGRVLIAGSPERVTMEDANDQHTAPNLNALAFELVGIELPLDHLPYWVRAIPHPERDFAMESNGQNQVVSIQQSGWNVTFDDYFDDSDLPRKMVFARGNDSGKLIIRAWQLSQITQY